MSRNRRLADWLGTAGTVFGIIGTLLLVGFLFNFVPTLLFAGSGVPATATVVRLDNRNGNYYPVISYQLPSGELHLANVPIGNNPPAFKVGEQVAIFYDQDDPREARINRFIYIWAIPLALGGLAAVLWLVAGLCLLLSRHFSRRIGYEQQPTAR